MASTGEVNPKRHGGEVEKAAPQGGSQGAEDDKVYRLTRHPPDARDAPDADAAAKPAAKKRPDDHKPSNEPHHLPASAAPGAPKKSRKRVLMFALLPVAVIVGGYFYVTGGAVMSTDNAYVQADMVGLSTDVSGIVTDVFVHDNQKVAKGDVLRRGPDWQHAQ
jgi:membrane fusion protein, multidrug efflux system